MRAIHTLLIGAIILCGLASFGRAQESISELRNVLNLYQAALAEGNATLLAGYLANDYLYVDPSGKAVDAKDRLKHAQTAKVTFTELAAENDTTRLHGQVVVVSGIATIKGKVDDREVDGRFRYVDVWMKRDGNWRAILTTITRIE